MATLLPPPKRQKVYHGVPEPPKEEPTYVPNIVVQFVSEDDGRSLAPAVNIPANVTREALELLVNKISPEVNSILSCRLIYSDYDFQDEEPVPFSFHVTLPEDSKTGQNSSARIVVTKSIEADVLNHPSGHFTPEDIIVIHCSPQSVFRVRPATRCSSTLSGIFVCYPDGLVSLTKVSQRTLITDSLCVILSNWETSGHGIWRYQRAIMGSQYRNTFTHLVGSQWLGSLC